MESFHDFKIAHWDHDPACEVAQASPPAGSPGVPPGVRAGSETLPQLAAGTACATRFMERKSPTGMAAVLNYAR